MQQSNKERYYTMAKKKAAPDRDALESLVEEMNEVLALDPPLKVGRKSTDEDLIEMICDEENSGEIFEADFVKTKGKKTFTADARETLEALGVVIQGGEEDEPEVEEKPTKKAPAKGKKVVEEEPEEEEEKPKAKKGAKKEIQEELPLEDEKPAKKSSKKVVEEEPEEVEEKPVKKGKKVVEEEPEEEAPKAKKGAKAVPAKAEKADKSKAKKEKSEKSEKYTRYMSVAEVLSSGKSLTESEIAEKANDLYVKHGGNEGVAQSERIVDRSLQLVRALGIVEEKAGKIKYTA